MIDGRQKTQHEVLREKMAVWKEQKKMLLPKENVEASKDASSSSKPRVEGPCFVSLTHGV